ncbi:MAG: rhomboid family intramembrane serine protease [Candidatus Sumerlaeia bacterium]|nr:rhomboid family intramembrane serine protease [Candidatus Sumerlaeia bacterium]
MLFPIGTREPVMRTPWVTWTLAVAMVAVHLACNVTIAWARGPYSLIAFLEAWAFTPSAFSWTTIGTSLFLHANLLHLLVNVWALLLFGRIVEDRLGPLLHAVLCLAGGAAGCLVYAWTATGFNRQMPVLGASGMVFAVIGALLVVAFWVEFRFFYFLVVRWGLTYLTSLWVAAFYASVNAVCAWAATELGQSALGGVAVSVHLGSLVAGLLLALLFRHGLAFLLPHPAESLLSREASSVFGRTRHRRRSASVFASAAEAEAHLIKVIRRGQHAMVAPLYAQMRIDHPEILLPPAEMLALGSALEEARELHLAREIYERTLLTASGDERAEALLRLAREEARDPGEGEQARRRLREVIALEPGEALRREAGLLLMRLAEMAPASTAGEVSALTRELEARVTGVAPRPAYVPAPIAGPPAREAPPPDDAWRQRPELPPPRPVYVPEAGTSHTRVPPTHAVILTGQQRIDVPRVAHVIARATRRSLVEAAAVVSKGMGVVLETADGAEALRAAEQLTANRWPAAAVALERMPETWEEIRATAGEVRGDVVALWTSSGECREIAFQDVITVAHATVPRAAGDDAPPVTAEIRALNPPRRVTALETEFRHRTAASEPTLRGFVLELAQRTMRAAHDAAILASLRLGRQACLRFDDQSQLQAYLRWLTLSALAGPGRSGE